jgi:hypothetical protein
LCFGRRDALSKGDKNNGELDFIRRSGAAHFYRGDASQPQNSPKAQTEMARHYSMWLLLSLLNRSDARPCAAPD